MNVKLVLLDGFTEKEGQMHELSSNVCTYIFNNIIGVRTWYPYSNSNGVNPVLS